MDVAIRELKAKLSAYVQMASSGQHITVTDRGRPVAILGPAIGRVDLAEAVEAGWVTPARSQGLRPVERRPSSRPTIEVLNEDRGE